MGCRCYCTVEDAVLQREFGADPRHRAGDSFCSRNLASAVINSGEITCNVASFVTVGVIFSRPINAKCSYRRCVISWTLNAGVADKNGKESIMPEVFPLHNIDSIIASFATDQ
jgi:hypothetical protein